MMENIFSEQILRDAETAFVRARYAALKDAPFCGTILMGLLLVFCESYRGQPVTTAATDGTHMFVNPVYFLSLSTSEQKSLVLHEGWHVILAHPWRRGNRNPKEWNISTDLSIHGFLVPSGQLIGEGWLYESKYNGWAAERIHVDKFGSANPPPPPEDGPWNDEPGDPGGEGQGSPSDDTGDEQNEVDTPHAGEVWDAVNEDGSSLSEDQKQEALGELSKDIQMAKEVEAQSECPAGRGGDQEDRLVDDVLSPNVNWGDRLRDKWSSFGQPESITYSRPSRRGLAMGYCLPSTTKRSLDTIVVAMDQSSSVERWATNLFWAQLRMLREDIPCQNLVILPFNSYCKEENVIEVSENEELPRVTRYGGGTRYSPIFHLITHLELQPDAVIVMTDMECKDYGDEPDYPVLWMSSEVCFDEPPFGEVIEVEID